MNPKSKIYLTLDFENGWGAAENGLWRERQHKGVYKELRPLLRRFVGVLDELEFSFTWAAVGAMIEKPGIQDFSHLTGIMRKQLEVFCAEADEMTKDGRDLLDIVLNASTPQTFGTHTYCHLRFQDDEQSDISFTKELEKAKQANQVAGIDFKRLVFPLNQAGHFDQVKAAGIEKVRVSPLSQGQSHGQRNAVKRALDAFLVKPSAVHEDTHSSGLILHHGTHFLNWGANGGAVKKIAVERNTRLALGIAERGEGDIHFWIHPFNLVETEALFASVVKTLREIAVLRDKELVETAAF